MASYKVIQDIEAEDKLIGPLSLRQFVYAAISVTCLYLSFIAITKNFPFMIILFVPVALVSGFFAFPWKGEQPTEVWALAKIRFLIKPRKRLWDQSGIKEMVTVTAPKQIEAAYSNGLSQTEVRSRLRALADTIDSRGWAIKNANLNLYTQTALVMAEPTSDRLLGPSTFPHNVEASDVQAADDMLDEINNPRAKQVGNMVDASTKAHRQKIIETLEAPTPPPAPRPSAPPAGNYWFLNQPSAAASVPGSMVTFNTQVVSPAAAAAGAPQPQPAAAPAAVPSTDDEKQLLQELEARKREMPMTAYYGHLHTIQPISAGQQVGQQQTAIPSTPQGAQQSLAEYLAQQNAGTAPQATAAAPAAQPATPAEPAQPAVTPKQQAAILQLASNDDLNVATIAREAQRSGSQNEVIIKLR